MILLVLLFMVGGIDRGGAASLEQAWEKDFAYPEIQMVGFTFTKAQHAVHFAEKGKTVGEMSCILFDCLCVNSYLGRSIDN